MTTIQIVPSSKIQKPFLKWVGGKTQIIDQIINHIPVAMHNYHEPFLGGGSVLFAVLSLQRQGRIQISGTLFASDANSALINTYQVVQYFKDDFYNKINELVNTYETYVAPDYTLIEPLTKPKKVQTAKEECYYRFRERFNQLHFTETINKSDTMVERASLFLFLNKTCFRGIYREGPHGFNVPFGHYAVTPTIITREELDIVSDMIRYVQFSVADFTESLSLQRVLVGDFVYIDPPYAPETSTSFVGYTATGFTADMHLTLFDNIKKVGKAGIPFIMSNSYVPLILKHFDKDEYEHTCITARRAINSKNPAATTKEVIVAWSPNLVAELVV